MRENLMGYLLLMIIVYRLVRHNNKQKKKRVMLFYHQLFWQPIEGLSGHRPKMDWTGTYLV